MKAKQEENGFVNVSMTKSEVLELAQDLIKMALADEQANVVHAEGSSVMIPPMPVTRTVHVDGTAAYRLVFFNLVHEQKPVVPKGDEHFPLDPEYMDRVLRNRWKSTANCWSEATGEIRDMCNYIGGPDVPSFAGIRNPGVWNKTGVDCVMRAYREMTAEHRGRFCNRFKEWLMEWEALLSL